MLSLETAVAIILCTIVLVGAGLIIYLTLKGFDKRVKSGQFTSVDQPIDPEPIRRLKAKKKPAKKKRRR